MFKKVHSCGIIGLDSHPVVIEVDISRGLPATIIVGLPDNAVRESKERIRSAIKNNGFKFGPQRTTINLSPADTKKEGPSFDLAMALGILAATQQIDCENLEKFCILGELSLDGKIQPVRGVLSAALALNSNKFQGLIIPSANALETIMTKNIKIYPVKNLLEAIQVLSDPATAKPFNPDTEQIFKRAQKYNLDFADVKGQFHVKRGLEIAAAGNHNVLLIGPPGSGKSMLAKRLPTILPNMSLEESLETTKIHSAVGNVHSNSFMATRPFRSPHHTTSDVAIVGGGSIPKPGEVTLSHNGILFLDELPEFSRNVLESLRQPLENHSVTIARTHKTISFPSKFILICAMNPCPCGFYTDQKKECHCTPVQIQRYVSKISGPLLDRIDMHLDVPALPSKILLTHNHDAESSHTIKERIINARKIQEDRFKDLPISYNTYMDQNHIKKFCQLSDSSRNLIKLAIEEFGLSARAYDKILRLARTIADLENNENIDTHHIAESIQYRSLDRW